MQKAEAMKSLETMGTAQNCKVYARHGVQGPMFGVSFANLNLLKKRIKTDHELALALWETGNHDARVLATMIADPARIDGKTLDAWARALGNYVLTDAFSTLAAQSPAVKPKLAKWTRAKGEWLSTAGWNVLARLVESRGALSDADLKDALAQIESGIHRAPNRTRYSMNTALIAIGMRPALTPKAIAAAQRIGRVEVDHGETGCKTPDAAAYIRKTVEYRKERERVRSAPAKAVKAAVKAAKPATKKKATAAKA
jgi:3-methyladenine DNA glycosylase AlkD